MVEVDFQPVVISPAILAFAVGGHEEHVQQCGASVQVELSARCAIDARVGVFGIGIARRGDAEKARCAIPPCGR